jgi:hypothetical protein
MALAAIEEGLKQIKLKIKRRFKNDFIQRSSKSLIDD